MASLSNPLIRFLIAGISHLISVTSLPSDPLLLIRCSDGSDDLYSSSSTYASNLRLLLSTLISTTPETETLFLVHREGAANKSRVFGLAQCRPDATPAVCSNCLAHAAESAVNVTCPGQKSAAVRDAYCVLRYADHLFASALEASIFSTLFRTDKASNPGEFSRQMSNMLAELLPGAMSNELRIAVGMKTINTGWSSMDLFGLAWCTLDLSPANCYQCLDHALRSYEECCGDTLGGGSAAVSCIVTYNNFDFFNYTKIRALSSLPANAVKGISTSSQTERIIMAISISASLISVLIIASIFFIWRRKLASEKTSKLSMEDVWKLKCRLLAFVQLRAATNNFSAENKLGEGRFGPVYKGVLMDGQQIVVKRLSKTSDESLVELRNEAALVAQLQHKNLVKFLGYCIQEKEKLLVYEYLPNSSLEKHLYDPAERAQLEWKRRHIIIEGIARGLVYLHNHSHLKIIHRDLKASSILLDGDMNPKISDFGLAKFVSINESQWNTKKIAGTFGYMAPEYATHGLFSTKSDVFSYGMVVLEIITGRRNISFIEVGNALNLQTYVWQHWYQGKAEEVVDQNLGGHYNLEVVLRLINIGLLCIQADPLDRPSMASVVLMLSTNTEVLPHPSLPAYFTGENPSPAENNSNFH